MVEPARRVFQSLIALLTSLVFSLAPFAAAHAQGIFNQNRYAAIVVDASTGEGLYAKHADDQRYPGSITKIMTLYLTFEAMATGRLSPTDTVIMWQHAARQSPSKLG